MFSLIRLEIDQDFVIKIVRSRLTLDWHVMWLHLQPLSSPGKQDRNSSHVVQLFSYVQLCDPFDCRTPDLPVLHHLLEFAQTYVHWVGDAIHPSHPLSPPFLAFNLSQHQGLFQWALTSGCQSTGASASVPAMNIQSWSPLGLTGLISLQSKGLSRVFSSTTIWKHLFFGAQPLWSSSHIRTWLLEKP